MAAKFGKVDLVVTPGTGEGTRVEVDGHDIAGACRGFTLHASVHEVPTLEVDLWVYDVATFQGRARIIVDDRTREALIALGWTPPPDEVEWQA